MCSVIIWYCTSEVMTNWFHIIIIITITTFTIVMSITLCITSWSDYFGIESTWYYFTWSTIVCTISCMCSIIIWHCTSVVMAICIFKYFGKWVRAEYTIIIIISIRITSSIICINIIYMFMSRWNCSCFFISTFFAFMFFKTINIFRRWSNNYPFSVCTFFTCIVICMIWTNNIMSAVFITFIFMSCCLYEVIFVWLTATTCY